MNDLDFLARYPLEHQLQSRHRSNLRRGGRASGLRRSARLLSQQLRLSRRHAG